METHFDLQLQKLKKRITKMSTLVDNQVENLLKAVSEQDHELAEYIISKEKNVDKYDLKIDKLCLKLVVLNQPVAMDMRFIFSAITINSNLERIGDHAANIARGILDVDYSKAELDLIQFEEISRITREMISKSVEAFIERDPELAKEVLLLEDDMNHLRDTEAAILKQYMIDHPGRIDSALFLYDMVHGLERIGDLSTNIVEDVYFMIEALNIRHKYVDILFDSEDSDEENDEEEDIH